MLPEVNANGLPLQGEPPHRTSFGQSPRRNSVKPAEAQSASIHVADTRAMVM